MGFATETPFYLAIPARNFLEIHFSLQGILPKEDPGFTKLLRTLFGIGVVIPLNHTSSAIDRFDRSSKPTVAFANAQWRRLLAKASEVSVRYSRCVQFVNSSEDDICELIVAPEIPKSAFRVTPHHDCPECVKRGCPVVSSSEETPFLNACESEFFHPMTQLLELAIKNGWGVSSGTVNTDRKPLALFPNARPIATHE